MKLTFEPKKGVEISIADDGDFCFEQDASKVFMSIGQVRGFMKKLPDLLKVADDKRAAHLRQSEVQ